MKKTNIKNPQIKPQQHIAIFDDTHISSSTLCFVQQFSERKMLCFIFSKNVNEVSESLNFKMIVYYSHFERICVIDCADTAP